MSASDFSFLFDGKRQHLNTENRQCAACSVTTMALPSYRCCCCCNPVDENRIHISCTNGRANGTNDDDGWFALLRNDATTTTTTTTGWGGFCIKYKYIKIQVFGRLRVGSDRLGRCGLVTREEEAPRVDFGSSRDACGRFGFTVEWGCSCGSTLTGWVVELGQWFSTFALLSHLHWKYIPYHYRRYF